VVVAGFGGARLITSSHASTNVAMAPATPAASIPGPPANVAPVPAAKPVVVATATASVAPDPVVAPVADEPSETPATASRVHGKHARQSHHKRHWARLFRAH
jgi:hypothetical protein